MRTKTRPLPQVTLGWVVKRRYRKQPVKGAEPDTKFYDKRVSPSAPFVCREAAEVFRRLAEANEREHPTEGAIDVSYYISDSRGEDGLAMPE